jgi:predicted O-methyltransferase YrrM
MFSFITEVIGGRADKHIIEEVRKLRREMLSDSRVVKVTDLGAGSTIMHGRERRIRQIAAAAALPAREVALLARIAASLDSVLRRVPDHQPDNQPVILELGTSLGISTLALALAAPHRRVITVEGCPELAATARENLRRHGADNVEVLNMKFTQALGYLRERGTKVGMAFIDGNHRGAALTDYTHRITEMGEEMIIVADDIHMNRDMIQSWRSLCPRQSKSGAATPSSTPASATGAAAPPSTPASATGAATPSSTSTSATGAATPPSTPTSVTGAATPPSTPTSATGAATPPSATGAATPPSVTGAATAPLSPQPDGSPATTSVETFRLGILFCLHNLTPGHYRIRY